MAILATGLVASAGILIKANNEMLENGEYNRYEPATKELEPNDVTEGIGEKFRTLSADARGLEQEFEDMARVENEVDSQCVL